jgi:hypothetical protein
MSFYLEIEPNGFGATYQSTIYGLALCRKYGWDFRFKPYNQIHNGSADKCNSFTGFNSYQRPDHNSSNIPYTQQLYGSRYEDLFTDDIINEVRQKYYSTEKPDNPYSNYVAIHIRRGDVNKKNHPDRWIETNDYIGFIRVIKEKYPDKKIVICSQGGAAMFEEIRRLFPDVVIDLQNDPLRHFNILVASDVLLPSLSSFSFIAGLLNKNTVINDIYHLFKFWHKPPLKWVSILMDIDVS